MIRHEGVRRITVLLCFILYGCFLLYFWGDVLEGEPWYAFAAAAIFIVPLALIPRMVVSIIYWIVDGFIQDRDKVKEAKAE